MRHATMRFCNVPAILLLAAAPAAAQRIFPERRVPPQDFAVMSWGTTPADAQQLEWMKQAGINLAGFARPADLPAFEAAGLQVFVSDPRVNGYDFDRPLDEEKVRRNVAALAREVGDSSAVFGFMLRDEPHARAMPSLGLVARVLREYFPGKAPYVNLFPVRVSAERMGTATYPEYVRLLVDTIRQPFLSYDNYSLVGGRMLDPFYTNLEAVRRISVETGVPFWNCVLSNAHFNYMENSDATYHLQAYATAAHGGRGIQYFSYFTWSAGNYRLGPIDQFGNRTPSWDMLRRVNNEIHALAPTLKRLRSKGVYHHPYVPPECRPLSDSALVEAVGMTQRYVEPPAQAQFLVGELADDAGRPYLMLVNKDLAHSFQFSITLRKAGKLVHVSPYSGQEEPFGREMDWIAPGAGHLFRIE